MDFKDRDERMRDDRYNAYLEKGIPVYSSTHLQVKQWTKIRYKTDGEDCYVQYDIDIVHPHLT